MSKHPNRSMPTAPFALLLVEGGDERSVCMAVAGVTWSGICCWTADGQTDLPNLAELAARDSNFHLARSVGVVMDAENSVSDALALAGRVLAAFGVTAAPAHAVMSSGLPRVGVFLMPDGVSPGATEGLCRHGVRDSRIAGCADAFAACVGAKHGPALSGKAWMSAYLAMLGRPTRFHEAFGSPDGIDPSHACFSSLRTFLAAL